jgi:fumarate reductase subunit D
MNFFIEHFWTIFGLVTGFGGVATVVVLLFSVPAALILANVIGFFKAAVEFFKTPIGQLVFLVAVVALCCFVTHIHDEQEALDDKTKALAQRDRQWKTKVDEAGQKFKEARLDRDKSVDTDLQKLVDTKDSEIATLQSKVENYEGPDHPGCVLTPADLAADGGVQQNGTTTTRPPALAKRDRKPWRFPFRLGR